MTPPFASLAQITFAAESALPPAHRHPRTHTRPLAGTWDPHAFHRFGFLLIFSVTHHPTSLPSPSSYPGAHLSFSLPSETHGFQKFCFLLQWCAPMSRYSGVKNWPGQPTTVLKMLLSMLLTTTSFSNSKNQQSTLCVAVAHSGNHVRSLYLSVLPWTLGTWFWCF